MTLKELSQLYYLKREIAMDRERLAKLDTEIARDSGRKFRKELVSLRMVIMQKHKRCIAELLQLEQYISSINDSFIRQIFTLRFVQGLSWRQVAVELPGFFSEDNLYTIARRYCAKRAAN